MTVYTDGKYAGTNGGRNKPVAFRLSPGTHVLAVRCLNLRGEAGILGSLSNALVTDSRWKCTGRGNRYRIKGKYWTKALFDDSDWPQAVEYFPNRGWTYWGKMSDISDKAFWIWTVDKGKHEEVYCRRRVSDVSVRHRKRGLLPYLTETLNLAPVIFYWHLTCRHVAELKRATQRFHMTSRRPCWCPKPILWELNSFLMQKISFVLIN